MSTNFSLSKISTSTRSPTLMLPSVSPFSSTSMGTSRRNFTGVTLFLAQFPRTGLVSRDSFTNSTRPSCAASYPSRAPVLDCVTTHGPACSTVAGRTSPFESKSCVMPTFFPKIPATFGISFSSQLGSRYWLGFPCSAETAALLMCFLAEGLDFHVHARGQIQLHQRVHRLRRRLENIEQTLVGADLELLARLLVHVRRTQHAVLVFHRGQRNRSRNLCPGAPSRLDDLTRGLVQDAVVVRFQPDANSFFSNHVSLANPFRLFRKERTGGKLQAAFL